MGYFDNPYTILVGGTSLSTGKLCWAWASKLERRLNGACSRRVRIIDAGKGSQTSDWGVTQIDWWKNFHADAAILEFSINDAATSLFAGSLAGHQTNMYSIIDGLRANNPNIDITIQTMSPVGPNGATARPDLAGFYQKDRDIATAKSCRLLDNNSAWPDYYVSKTGAALPTTQYYLPNDGTWTVSNDGLHPIESRVDDFLVPRLFNHFRKLIEKLIYVSNAPPTGAQKDFAFSYIPVVDEVGKTITWSYTGTLAPGLSFNTGTGAVTGTPTTEGVYHFTVTGTSTDGWTVDPIEFNLSVSTQIIPTFKTSQHNAVASTSVAKPAGLAVGDLVVVLASFDGATSMNTVGGSAWGVSTNNWPASYSYTSSVFYKVLDANDVANAWTINASVMTQIAVYQPNGANRISVKSSTDTGGGVGSFNTPTYAPSASHAGAVIIVCDRDDSNSDYVIGDFTVRQSNNSNQYFWCKIADKLTGHNGGAVSITGLNVSSSYSQVVWVLEFDLV